MKADLRRRIERLERAANIAAGPPLNVETLQQLAVWPDLWDRFMHMADRLAKGESVPASEPQAIVDELNARAQRHGPDV